MAGGRTRKRKRWIWPVVYKLQGHWRSVPVSYLHGYFKRKNKQGTPQLPISILRLSETWHRPRHGRHRELRRPAMAHSRSPALGLHSLTRQGGISLKLICSRDTAWLLRTGKSQYSIFPWKWLMKCLSKRDAQLQMDGVLLAEESLKTWDPFFWAFCSIMSEHDLSAITIVWLAGWEEHVGPFYCSAIFIS